MPINLFTYPRFRVDMHLCSIDIFAVISSTLRRTVVQVSVALLVATYGCWAQTNANSSQPAAISDDVMNFHFDESAIATRFTDMVTLPGCPLT